jgi:hypothetical protein
VVIKHQFDRRYGHINRWRFVKHPGGGGDFNVLKDVPDGIDSDIRGPVAWLIVIYRISNALNDVAGRDRIGNMQASRSRQVLAHKKRRTAHLIAAMLFAGQERNAFHNLFGNVHQSPAGRMDNQPWVTSQSIILNHHKW